MIFVGNIWFVRCKYGEFLYQFEWKIIDKVVIKIIIYEYLNVINIIFFF